MKFSSTETTRQEAYVQPSAELIALHVEHPILDDSDNTGGTGHNLPWDD